MQPGALIDYKVLRRINPQAARCRRTYVWQDMLWPVASLASRSPRVQDSEPGGGSWT